MYRHLMVPLDDSDLSVNTIDRAVLLARALGAKITFLHADAHKVSTIMQRKSSMKTTRSSEDLREPVRALFAKAEAMASEAGVPCASLVVSSFRPYEAILDAAEARGCDLVFMASHGNRDTQGFLLGSQTLKVLQHATIPVLVSATESNLSDPRNVAPLTVIRSEHNAIAVVIHGLEYLVRPGHERNGTGEFPLLRAILYYISAFPEKLHHPKEDTYLFRKLRERTPQFNDTLDELERQHVVGRELVADLDRTLARYEADPAGGFDAFAAAAQNFAAMQWQHMKLEEKVIIPAAEKYLTHDDLAEIASAFAQNGDPRFSPGANDEFMQLFTDIITLAPKRIVDGQPH